MSFNCSLTSNVPLECRIAVPGITSVFIFQIQNLSTLTLSGSTGVVSAIALTPGGGYQAFRYDFEKYTGKAQQDMKASSANGVVSVDQTIDIQLLRYEQVKRAQIYLLAQQDVGIITLNNDGTYWLFGATKGMTLTDTKSDFGTKGTDFSGWKLTFKGEEPVESFQVPSGLIAALLIPS